MPRNRSEKAPQEAEGIDPDFYKLLRMFAGNHVSNSVLAASVRDGSWNWGGSEEGESLFRTFSNVQQDVFWRWPTHNKIAYVADYMEHLYAAQ